MWYPLRQVYLLFQEQYMFLHYALLEALMSPTTATPAKDFLRLYEDLKEFDPKHKKRRLQIEFDVCHCYLKNSKHVIYL